jgi:hypothetical protein
VPTPTPLRRISPAAALLAVALLGGLAGCREADPYYRYGLLPDAEANDDTNDDDAGATADAAGTADPDAGASCPTCPVRVLYTCRSDDMYNASFILDVTNQSSASITLADLTLRYWYTRDQHAQALDCDTAKLGCTNLASSGNVPPAPTPRFQDVLPPRPLANEYVEIAFTLGALALDPGLDTGEIQLRLHDADHAPINQTDDYSSQCDPTGYAFPSNRITAYLDGVLVWGLEPPL